MGQKTIIDELKSNQIRELLEQGQRIDGRSFDEHRPLSIEAGVIPKQAEHIYKVVQNMKPAETVPAGGTSKRSKDEMVADIMKRLENFNPV